MKIYRNPTYYIDKFSNYLQSLLLWGVRVIFYKKISFFTYISFKSSIKNHKVISLGKKVEINPFVVLWPTSLVIGNNVQINPGTSIYGRVVIGNNVMIAPNCMIVGGNHGIEKNGKPMIYQNSTEKGVFIEDDVWIGANSVICDGVKIAKGTVIGAGSVVTKDTEPYSIYIGVPAKFLKYRL